jgi:DNA-directed RNA polymerase specialized sigma24 family protein
VVLRDLEGLDTHEAAALLAISDSALKVRLHRGHAALRRSLAPYLAEPLAGNYRN